MNKHPKRGPMSKQDKSKVARLAFDIYWEFNRRISWRRRGRGPVPTSYEMMCIGRMAQEAVRAGLY